LVASTLTVRRRSAVPVKEILGGHSQRSKASHEGAQDTGQACHVCVYVCVCACVCLCVYVHVCM